MIKRLLFLLLSFGACSAVGYGQGDTTAIAAAGPAMRHVRISLLTIGPGEILFEAFGHSCIRVIDSSRIDKKRDVIYNYGTFANSADEFMEKMADGTLQCYLSVFPYEPFVKQYVEENRGLEEQVFDLNDTQRTALITKLEENTLPKNRYYQYDFFTDNCSTRVYQIIAGTYGGAFAPGVAMPQNIYLSYYDGSYQYYPQRHWERVGVGILFEHWMSQRVTDSTLMFLPYYVSKAIGGARLDGKKFCKPAVQLRAEMLPVETKTNGPFVLTCIIALLTIAGLSFSRLRLLGRVMSWVVLIISGLLGSILLYAWMGPAYRGCENNLNLLWAVPINLIILFLKPRVKAVYAIAAIALIGVALMLHIFRVLVLPLFELTPFLLALVWVFATMYRKNSKPVALIHQRA